MIDTSVLSAGVAQFATALALSVGTFSFLFPKTMLRSCNAPTGPMNTYLFELTGALTAVFGCAMLSTIFLEKSHSEAAGLSMIPLIISGLKDMIISRPDKTLGLSASTYLRRTIGGCFVAYCGLSGVSYADAVVRTAVAIITAVGLALVLLTEAYPKQWGNQYMKSEPILLSSLRSVGLHLLAYSVYMICIDRQVDPIRAVGYAWIPMLLNTALALFGPTAKEFNLSVLSLLSWLVIAIFVIASTIMA